MFMYCRYHSRLPMAVGQNGSGGAGGARRPAHRVGREPGRRAGRGRSRRDGLPAKGVVKRVEKELEHVTIDHEAIPGFMDAMKMRFSYKDRDVLDRLQPGDAVEGTLRVETEDGVVNDYRASGPGRHQAGAAAPHGQGRSAGQGAAARATAGGSRSATWCPISP